MLRLRADYLHQELGEEKSPSKVVDAALAPDALR
jgi:hypothetical protein